MKKALIVCAVIVVALSLAACKGKGAGGEVVAGGGKYADVEKVFGKYIDANEKFATALEGAKTADDVVAAINTMTDTTKAVAPELKAFETKYPEFKNQDNPPAELKPLMDRMMAAGGRMIAAMQKLGPLATDPKVVEAQAKFQAAMDLMK
jgi:predicted small secreted protein